MAEWEWSVSQEAKVGINRELAVTRLNELIEFLKSKITKKPKKS